MTPANVHDINYMKDVKFEFHDCSIFGDRTYISAELKQNLFSSVGIRLEVPYRLNMKDWKPAFKPFAKARKRIETNPPTSLPSELNHDSLNSFGTSVIHY